MLLSGHRLLAFLRNTAMRVLDIAGGARATFAIAGRREPESSSTVGGTVERFTMITDAGDSTVVHGKPAKGEACNQLFGSVLLTKHSPPSAYSANSTLTYRVRRCRRHTQSRPI